MKNYIKIALVVIMSCVCAFGGFMVAALLVPTDDEPGFFLATMFFFIPVICVVSNYIFSKKE